MVGLDGAHRAFHDGADGGLGHGVQPHRDEVVFEVFGLQAQTPVIAGVADQDDAKVGVKEAEPSSRRTPPLGWAVPSPGEPVEVVDERHGGRFAVLDGIRGFRFRSPIAAVDNKVGTMNRGGHFQVGQRVLTTDDTRLWGRIVDDYGSLADTEVIVDDEKTVRGRRWAVELDDGRLVFVDDDDIELSQG